MWKSFHRVQNDNSVSGGTAEAKSLANQCRKFVPLRGQAIDFRRFLTSPWEYQRFHSLGSWVPSSMGGHCVPSADFHEPILHRHLNPKAFATGNLHWGLNVMGPLILLLALHWRKVLFVAALLAVMEAVGSILDSPP